MLTLSFVFWLQVLPCQGWPLAARNGPAVDNWLGKKVRQEIKSLPCYFVPKRIKGRNLSEDAKGERNICLLLLLNFIKRSKDDLKFLRHLRRDVFHVITTFLHIFFLEISAELLDNTCFLSV